MRQPFRSRRAASAALLGVLAACSPNALKPTLTPVPIELCRGACADSVEVTYLGRSGFIIRSGGSAIMTSPAFTNPGMLRAAMPFWRTRSDTALVAWMMRPLRLDDISAVLVGHSHYDHLMDGPFIAALVPRARWYGSPTMANLMEPATGAMPLTGIDGSDVGTPADTGRWYWSPDSAFRFMAVQSSHAPNFKLGPIRYTYSPRSQHKPRSTAPSTLRAWRMGPTYAYVIDVMRAGRPAFRVYYQDSAAEPEWAGSPWLADGKSVDVLIVCAGNHSVPRNYPQSFIDSLRPEHVIVSHWESFFRDPMPPFRTIPLLRAGNLASKLKSASGTRWVTPVPRARIVYRF